MRRVPVLIVMAMLLLTASAALAETQVKMTGDSRVYGVYFTGHNFTGWNNSHWTSNTPTWNQAGSQTEESFEIWQRIRVRSDYIANENVRFRLAVKVDSTWGSGTYTAANPTTAVQVYQAFLKFKWPDTTMQVSAGLQPLGMPQSALFNDSIVFTDFAAALVIQTELIPGTLAVKTGFARPIDTNQTFDDDTTQQADELDFYFLTLPVTTDAIKFTPWMLTAVAGRNTGYYTRWASSFGHGTYAEDLLSAGTMLSPTKWRNNQNLYVWAGGAFEVTALDPVRFYGDVIYGGGAMNDRAKSQRSGWFLDFGMAYTGWDIVTPQVFAWWASGEDGSTSNGSERMPHSRPNWGAGGSFLFDDSQVFARNSNMGIDPTGSMGFGVSLNNIHLMEKLTQRLTFTYIKGTNSPRAIRDLNNSLGSNPYFCMGRDLTWNEYAMGINLDSNYELMDNLALRMETGWAHGHFQKSVWGSRLADKGNSNDTWKVAIGMTYRY